MDSKKEKAILRVISMENVPDEVKDLAIIPLEGGYDPDFVIREVQVVQDVVTNLQKMPGHLLTRLHLRNRRRLAEYRRLNPDTKFADV